MSDVTGRITPRGINIACCVSWLRQEENQHRSVPFEIARTLPTELSRLMCHAREACELGYAHDTRYAITVLKPEYAQTGLGELLRVTRNLDRRATQSTATLGSACSGPSSSASCVPRSAM